MKWQHKKYTVKNVYRNKKSVIAHLLIGLLAICLKNQRELLTKSMLDAVIT